jgi:hypothetical protein
MHTLLVAVTLRAALTAVAALTLATSAADAGSVLMISVDGMKPEYVTQADRHEAA